MTSVKLIEAALLIGYSCANWGSWLTAGIWPNAETVRHARASTGLLEFKAIVPYEQTVLRFARKISDAIKLRPRSSVLVSHKRSGGTTFGN